MYLILKLKFRDIYNKLSLKRKSIIDLSDLSKRDKSTYHTFLKRI